MTQRTIPGTQLRAVAVPSTPCATVLDITSAANRRARVISVKITMVCDATVTTRNISMKHVTSGNVQLGPILTGSAATAGQTKVFSFGGFRTIAGTITSDVADYVLTDPLDVEYGNTMIRFLFPGSVAGDNYSGEYLLEEWAE